MPNFKPRNEKVIRFNKKQIQTLDYTHKNKLKEFSKQEKDIPKLEKRKEQLKKELSILMDKKQQYLDSNPDLLNVPNQSIPMQSDINDRVEELTTIRLKLKQYKHEYNKYLLDNSKYVFEYFGDKKDLTDNSNKVILHNFFSGKKEKVAKHDATEQTNVKQYMRNIDDNNYDLEDYQVSTNKCKNCDGEMIPVEAEGMMICRLCHCQQPYLIDQEKTSYKEPPKEISFFAYKRINHFREILAQFQAKESTKIDKKVIDDIKKQITKQRITLKDLTNAKTKSILKLLGYNKYYEHIPFIKEKLGIKPPTMPIQLEQTLCNLFMEIQKPYAKFCPSERVNFLNYYYVLYKLCELLGEDSYLPHFYLLKDPIKRMEQDEIWKKICGELNWEFIPTP